MLSDRSYLALWAYTEYQTRQGAGLLAEAAAREKAMWAALKGEEEPADAALMVQNRYLIHDEPDQRLAYAWKCWRRLAAPLLTSADRLVPTAAVDQ